MSDIKPSTYVVASIFFIIAILGVISLINMAAVDDPAIIPNDGMYLKFQQSFNKSEALRSNITALESKLNAGGSATPLDVINVIYFKGWSVISSLFTTFGFMDAIITGAGIMFGQFIPNWLPPLLITFSTSIILFAIVSAVLNKDL